MSSNDHSLENFIPDRERDHRRSRFKRISQWFLLHGKRTSVTAFLLLCVLLALLLMSIQGTGVDMRSLLTETNTVQSLFNTLLSGIILLVSIVVSINSIVFAQEITDLESQRNRIDASIRYRDRIDEFMESDASPARPAEFLRAILRIIDRQAMALNHIADQSDDDQFREEMARFVDQITEEAERAGETLSTARFGTFKVLLAGLNYDYSRQLHGVHRFKRKYSDRLDDDEAEVIDDLIDTLKFFATGREYFKSLYYKRELARLSSRLLYVSLPAILFTSYVLLALDAKLFPREMALPVFRLFGIPSLPLFVSIAYTVALAPFVILTAYIARAVTVTLNTLAAGPFILERGMAIDEFDWEHENEEWEVEDHEMSFTDD